jgi:hypothetical protein
VTQRGDPKYKKRNPNEGKRKARKGKRRTAALREEDRHRDIQELLSEPYL